MVRQGIGSDPRIGYHFLYPGVGYGGSCFPKDVKALQHTATRARPRRSRCSTPSKRSTTRRSACWSRRSSRASAPTSPGRTFALWGLAFKPNTDDMREAPSREIVAALAARGATIVAYDPVAMTEAQRVLWRVAPQLSFAASPMAALKGADALVVVTEWKEFRSPDFDAIREALREPLVFDGRNLYEPAVVRAAGLEYFAIGRR